MVAYNAYMADDVGVFWCMVVENEAGYRPMIGSNPMQAPWYLAHFEHFIDEQGKIDYKAANESADIYIGDMGVPMVGSVSVSVPADGAALTLIVG